MSTSRTQMQGCYEVQLLHRISILQSRAPSKHELFPRFPDMPSPAKSWREYISFVVSLLYPASLLASMGYAIHARITKGTAADIMHSSLHADLKAGASYSTQWVFNKPISNKKKLEENLLEVASEIGMKPERVDIVWEKEVPRQLPKGAALEADHYVERGWNFCKSEMVKSWGKCCRFVFLMDRKDLLRW